MNNALHQLNKAFGILQYNILGNNEHHYNFQEYIFFCIDIQNTNIFMKELHKFVVIWCVYNNSIWNL